MFLLGLGMNCDIHICENYSAMFIHSISFSTNHEYELKLGSTFSFFSLIHENGNIVYPPISTRSVVPMWNLCDCTRHLH